MIFSASPTFGRADMGCSPPLADHVVVIVLMRSEKQVIGVHAGWYVALMADKH